MSKKKSVFVVHGRNYSARDAAFNFLRSIHLEPIEWSQAVKLTGKASPNIIEIIEKGIENAQSCLARISHTRATAGGQK